MKNKSGHMRRCFTLVEVVATIVILAVILSIAVPIYNGVRENINESVYESKLREILSKAESYATETNRIVFDVGTLIEEGELSADNEIGEFKDPRTGRDMSCDIVQVLYKNNQYEASLTESTICYDPIELENLYGMIQLVFYDMSDQKLEKIEGTELLFILKKSN